MILRSLMVISCSAVLGIIFPTDVTAQDECCKCYNHYSGTKHYFAGGNECDPFCSSQPQQCTACSEVEEEGGDSGCHAPWSDPELGLTCMIHGDCEITEENPLDQDILAAHLVSGEDLAVLGLLRQHRMPARVLLNSKRQAIQVLNCGRTGMIGHYPVSETLLESIKREGLLADLTNQVP